MPNISKDLSKSLLSSHADIVREALEQGARPNNEVLYKTFLNYAEFIECAESSDEKIKEIGGRGVNEVFQIIEMLINAGANPYEKHPTRNISPVDRARQCEYDELADFMETKYQEARLRASLPEINQVKPKARRI